MQRNRAAISCWTRNAEGLLVEFGALSFRNGEGVDDVGGDTWTLG